ncbi:uncharacterized protein LOC135114385 [Scylla paramamosain]|uniref:uncharacterized protein LOC135114385 n=1 Tax=Scylla paramamosain TaxID=85552 RepID=UPI003083A010
MGGHIALPYAGCYSLFCEPLGDTQQKRLPQRFTVMFTKVMLLPCFLIVLAECSNHEEKAAVGQAVGALLSVGAETSCSLIIVTNTNIDETLKLQELRHVWRKAVTMLEVEDDNQYTNTTHTLSLMVPVLRQVRRLSQCTLVLVVSHDSKFLAAFAEWSMKGRLLVWATRLMVVTRLALPQLQPLLTAYWTYSMMNAAFLSLNDVSSSYPVFTYLPYTPAGPQVVHVASWTPLLGVVVTEGHMLFPEKFSNFYGTRVNVTALPFAPFWEERKGLGNITLYSGTDYYTLAAIASALNFTIYVVPTSSWAEVRRR